MKKIILVVISITLMFLAVWAFTTPTPTPIPSPVKSYDVCYIYDVGTTSSLLGKVVMIKPTSHLWSSWELGEHANSAGLRLAVETMRISPVLLDLLGNTTVMLFVDDPDVPTSVSISITAEE